MTNSIKNILESFKRNKPLDHDFEIIDKTHNSLPYLICKNCGMQIGVMFGECFTINPRSTGAPLVMYITCKEMIVKDILE